MEINFSSSFILKLVVKHAPLTVDLLHVKQMYAPFQREKNFNNFGSKNSFHEVRKCRTLDWSEGTTHVVVGLQETDISKSSLDERSILLFIDIFICYIYKEYNNADILCTKQQHKKLNSSCDYFWKILWHTRQFMKTVFTKAQKCASCLL